MPKESGTKGGYALEVACWRTFSLGNNRDYTNGAGTKLLLSQPLSSRLSIHYDYYSVKMPERSFLAMQPRIHLLIFILAVNYRLCH